MKEIREKKIGKKEKILLLRKVNELKGALTHALAGDRKFLKSLPIITYGIELCIESSKALTKIATRIMKLPSSERIDEAEKEAYYKAIINTFDSYRKI